HVRSGLYPVSATRFSTDIEGVELEFHRDPASRYGSVSYRCAGSVVRATRMEDDERLPLELLDEGRVTDAVSEIRKYRDQLVTQVKDLEAKLNLQGYVFLREERYADAIEIFKLNVDLFPQSSNVYDSLGEGYMLSGDVDSAIANYEKSLELNPDNLNAVAMLEKLRG
ncbi:MAG: tetratricopeptide repeat protein, partial [Candidatus Latescibacterota bacterium]